MNRMGVAIVLLIMLFSMVSAEAASIVMTLDDLTFTEGEAGPHYVDVLLTSPDGVGLASYGFKFQIAPVTGTSVLKFATAQPDPSLMPGYVFEHNVSGWFFGSVAESSPNLRDIYSGIDNTGDFADVGLPTAAPEALLARLQLEHIGAVAPDSEHTFQISVIAGPADTVFYNSAYSSLDFSSSGGRVTVLSQQSPNAVPEPTAAVTWFGLSAMGMLGLRRRRRGCKSS